MLFFDTPLSCPGSNTLGLLSAQHSSLLSHTLLFPPQNRVRKFGFPGKRDMKEGESRPTAPSEQERVSPDMPCLIAFLQAHLRKQ